MSAPRQVVVDANILIRAVFGLRTRDMLGKYQDTVDFYTPDACVCEALEHAPSIARKKRLDPEVARGDLRAILDLCINIVDLSFYEELEAVALVCCDAIRTTGLSSQQRSC